MNPSQADGAQRFLDQFADEEAIAGNADGRPRFLPGFEAMHRMTGVLLDEVVPADGRVLILGTGGGLETKAFAETHPGWRLVGVDPAQDETMRGICLDRYAAYAINRSTIALN